MEGPTKLQVKIGKHLTPHIFAVNNLNMNIILGRDWLKQDRVYIYFDLGTLRFNNDYVTEEYANIASIHSLDRPVVLKPDHIHTCVGETSIGNEYGNSYQT